MGDKANKVVKHTRKVAELCKTCNLCTGRRDSLLCSKCTQKYHFDCAGVSEKLYLLMDATKRKKWKCKNCLHKINNPKSPQRQSTSTPIPSVDIADLSPHKSPNPKTDETNSIFGNKTEINIPTSNSFASLSSDDDDDDKVIDEIGTICQNLNRSCPDVKLLNHSETIAQLQQKIVELQITVHNRGKLIDHLVLENGELGKKLKEHELKIDSLTRICKSTSKKKINNKTRLSTKKLDFTQEPTSNKNTTIPNQQEQDTKEDDNNITVIEDLTSTKYNNEKPKLCILSSNKTNKVSAISQTVFPSNYSICHYLSPGCDTMHLLNNLKNKLQGYTMRDFCIIFISEEDFKTTKEYYYLIEYINLTLLNIDFTNVIICLPTYKCGRRMSDIFNCRISHFNQLLYLNNLTYEYAYILDSNLNLKYDDTMFNKFNSRLNNRGMNMIIKDLYKLINEINTMRPNEMSLNNSEQSINVDEKVLNTSNFFRV